MDEPEELELSKYCKDNCGLDVKGVADYAQVSRRTLYDWWKTRTRAVKLIIKGINTELN